VFLLLERSLGPDLQDYLASGGRKIDQWFARHALAEADLGDRRECFINVNDADERARVEALLRSHRPPA
jgi:molybdopterin-guanine dinucleotide biosynthesis protein A